MCHESKEEVLFIGVTDKADTNNRKYSDAILSLCQQAINENVENDKCYSVIRHDGIGNSTDLCRSLYCKIASCKYFIVLLDQYDEGYNANVFFELGLISTISEAKIIFVAKESTKVPFDVGSDKNIIKVSTELLNVLTDMFGRVNFIAETAYAMNERNITNFKINFKKAFEKCNNPFTVDYEAVMNKKINGFDSFGKLLKELRVSEILEQDNGNVKYIDGEEAAFNALIDAVNNAKHSLRTSRFANQSIVKTNNKSFHQQFMEALEKASYRIDGRFDRIICINSVDKWYDVYTALSKFNPEKTKIYLRKSDFSIKFELVIIDEKISFIHFYLVSRNSEDRSSSETIRSTLKITGSTIGKELADIFDRLHHRDYSEREPRDLSRTLLGVEEDENRNLKEESRTHGYLSLKGKSVTNRATGMREGRMHNYALDEIKKILQWNIVGEEKEYLEEFIEETKN
ncbi:MAG: hypothetical protein IJA34_11560 [Lachnospiraceae bacterium]|nr:hypothetical protein [Lachnospiraceae bacterium]